MAFEPPDCPRPMRALLLANWPTPYLLKGVDDDDSAWNLVEEKPIAAYSPGLPENVTVKYADGDVRWFEPNEDVLVGDVTNRLGGERQEIREVAEVNEWDRAPDSLPDWDVFSRGKSRVEVQYDGDTSLWAYRFEDGKKRASVPTGSGRVAAIQWLKLPRP